MIEFSSGCVDKKSKKSREWIVHACIVLLVVSLQAGVGYGKGSEP